MKIIQHFSIVLMLFFGIGCSGTGPVAPMTVNPGQNNWNETTSANSHSFGQFIPWGYYDLEIARDGSFAEVVPNRSADASWGYHMNIVKLLEVDPCTDCLRLSNLHVNGDGDVSVDISITHPWPSDNLYCTGFDVRGIIMFPASQKFPDNEMRQKAGLTLWGDGLEDWKYRYSTSDKGDSELMNPDGWTSIWAPDYDLNNRGDFQLEEGQPIFDYFPGRNSSGENLGTINPYKRFYSNEIRHMFEPGETVTRTYVIRPPSVGNIQASYAVYAHWAPPDEVPVTNPVEDFPPEANSPLPYEFRVYQDEPIDPDAPYSNNEDIVHFIVKSWSTGSELWHCSQLDLLYLSGLGGQLTPHPDGDPDDYSMGFDVRPYKFFDEIVPSTLPGKCPFIIVFRIDDPKKPWWPYPIGTEYYIVKIDIEESDGVW